MNLTAEQIEENWKNLIGIITNNFSGERCDNLITMYESLKDRILIAPASGIEHFHNCFPGGYLDHVLRVIEFSEKIFNLWTEAGATIDYSKEELIFVALNHDLGKIGDLDNDHYIPNPSEWHRKNQGKIYSTNPDIIHMSVPHRGLWLLQEHDIKLSKNEMISILVHDGAYEDANATYLKSYLPERSLRTNLPIIIHHADHMASRIECEIWQKNRVETKKPQFMNTSKTNRLRNLANKNTTTSSASKLFDDLFKE